MNDACLKVIARDDGQSIAFRVDHHKILLFTVLEERVERLSVGCPARDANVRIHDDVGHDAYLEYVNIFDFLSILGAHQFDPRLSIGMVVVNPHHPKVHVGVVVCQDVVIVLTT